MAIKVRIGGQWVPVSGGGGESIGLIMAWGGSSDNIPSGYLLCDGTPISRSTYSELFSAIGVTHGSGDGQNTFNLPNLKDKFIVGASLGTGDTAYPGVSPGSTGGSANAVLIAHNHEIQTHDGHSQGDDGDFNATEGDTVTNKVTTTTGKDAAGNNSTTQTGTNANLPPYYALCYIIKVFNARTTVTGGVGGSLTVENNGSQLSSTVGVINFSSGLTASGSGANITVKSSFDINARTSGYSAVASDNGKLITMTTGDLSILSGVFSAGDVITVANISSSSFSILQQSGVTLRFAGSSLTGNRTLAQRGIATITCVSSNEFIISGSGLL